MNSIFYKKILLSACILYASLCFSQNQRLDTLSGFLNASSIKEATVFLDNIDTTALDSHNKAFWFFHKGIIEKKRDKHDVGFRNLLRAKKLFSEIDSTKQVANTNYEIVILLSHQEKGHVKSKPFLDEYISYAKSQNDPLILARAYSRIGTNYMHNNDAENTFVYYRKTINELKKNNDSIRIALIEMNIGVTYYSVKKNADSALYYYQKVLPIFKKHKLQHFISTIYNNQAKAYELKGNNEKALELFQKTNTIPLAEYDQKTRAIYYKNQLKIYKKVKDYENAFKSAKNLLLINDSINNTQQNIAISEIQEKYNNEKLRADNAETKANNITLQSENDRKNSQIIIILISLFLVIITAYLVQKNTRKKQLLAEQEKMLEQQKVATLLKEQELASIDAMIEGQEKERQRIANDLHDDLGGLMATIRLHFDNIKSGKNKTAIQHTDTLLDEAYTKIRSIAHAKNSGVIANQGLLVAVQHMAEKISAANKINIEVIDFGLDERIENSLELALFRIIQELTTNIIKHSQATKATIQLTQHENSLNIIIEDNGVGFDVNTIKKTGIGIHTIEKRVEHLNGDFTIDSIPDKGTSVIIDIPMK